MEAEQPVRSLREQAKGCPHVGCEEGSQEARCPLLRSH